MLFTASTVFSTVTKLENTDYLVGNITTFNFPTTPPFNAGDAIAGTGAYAAAMGVIYEVTANTVKAARTSTLDFSTTILTITNGATTATYSSVTSTHGSINSAIQALYNRDAWLRENSAIVSENETVTGSWTFSGIVNGATITSLKGTSASFSGTSTFTIMKGVDQTFTGVSSLSVVTASNSIQSPIFLGTNYTFLEGANDTGMVSGGDGICSFVNNGVSTASFFPTYAAFAEKVTCPEFNASTYKLDGVSIFGFTNITFVYNGVNSTAYMWTMGPLRFIFGDVISTSDDDQLLNFASAGLSQCFHCGVNSLQAHVDADIVSATELTSTSVVLNRSDGMNNATIRIFLIGYV